MSLLRCNKCGVDLSFMNHEQQKDHRSECGGGGSSYSSPSKPIHKGRKGRFGN